MTAIDTDKRLGALVTGLAVWLARFGETISPEARAAITQLLAGEGWAVGIDGEGRLALRPRTLARALDVTERTLIRWRQLGRGPSWTSVDGRPLYPVGPLLTGHNLGGDAESWMPRILDGLRAESKMLRRLLAIVHRDGGHHTDTVGIAGSVADAEAKLLDLLAATCSPADHPRTHDVLRRDCTRDPIYLFQRRVPVWYPAQHPEVKLALLARSDADVADVGSTEGLTTAEAIENGWGEWQWRTESVFLTRSEGEEHGNRRAYNYPDGWRVYCVAAEGALCNLLAAGTVGGRYK